MNWMQSCRKQVRKMNCVRYWLLIFLSFCINTNVVFAQKTIIQTIDSIAVYKSERKLDVFFKNKRIKSYNIGLGKQPAGAKSYQGDGKTPEGKYFICAKNQNTHYHKALLISYPAVKDVIWANYRKTKAGANVEIHGLPNGYTDRNVPEEMNDWTAGCIALKNKDIDEIYGKIKVGTPIFILP
jgi:murein L,D-transpeptidase YafK